MANLYPGIPSPQDVINRAILAVITDISGNLIQFSPTTGISNLLPLTGGTVSGSIVPSGSGTINLGSVSNPWGNVYVENIIVSSGNYVHITGDTMTGPLYNNVISNAGAPWIKISGSVAEGNQTIASGTASHAEGYQSQAFGNHSHAEGDGTIASGTSSHAEGHSTVASGNYAHAEGNGSYALGDNSHAENEGYVAPNAVSSHAENSSASYGRYSHAEGQGVTYGDYSHAEGTSESHGQASHTEGSQTYTFADNAHAQGNGCVASGTASFAAGTNANALHDYSTVFSDQYGASSTAINQFTASFRSGVVLTSGTHLILSDSAGVRWQLNVATGTGILSTSLYV